MQVYIEKLTFKTIIGILPFERVKKQKVIVDLSFKYIFSSKNNSDDFIDYSEVSSLVKITMKKKKFKLIEDAILTLEKKIYKKFKLKNLKIKISKPDILKDCLVSVSN